MLKVFNTVRRGFQFHKNVSDELFGYLKKCKKFCVSNTTGFLKLRNWITYLKI